MRGSSILLSGPPATHKLPLGLSLIASELEHCREDQGVLVISLREDAPTIGRVIRNYPQLGPMWGSDGGLDPRVRVVHRPPDYYTAERFVDWVRDTIRGRSITTVLFNSLSQLEYNSPMFSDEALFIAVLIEVFKKEEITSLFIDVADNEAGGSVGNIFDTILFTAYDGAAGGYGSVLRVSHTGPGNANRNNFAVERDPVEQQLTLRETDRPRSLRPIPDGD